MKGICTINTGKSEEGHELVKKGLQADIKSPLCWHVFGLMHKADKNYNEAIKAYKMALRLEKVCVIPPD